DTDTRQSGADDAGHLRPHPGRLEVGVELAGRRAAEGLRRRGRDGLHAEAEVTLIAPHSFSNASTTHVTLSVEPRSRARVTRWSAHSLGSANWPGPESRSLSLMWLVSPSLARISRSPARGVNGRTWASSFNSAHPKKAYRRLRKGLVFASSAVRVPLR